MKKTLFAVFILFLAGVLHAKIVTKSVDYEQDGVVLEGFLAYDDAVKGKVPGVLIIHEWNGLQDYMKKRAVQTAGLGYVAFAADIYGKGIRPKNREESGKEAGKYRGDRKLMRARANAGLNELKKFKFTDADKLAVMGYCFGGTAALELARSGAMIKGAVAFHGNTDTPDPRDAKNIKGRVLILHGAKDRSASCEAIDAFRSEMDNAGKEWEMVLYSGAVHAFTNPDAGSNTSTGAAYNKKADEKSWEQMKMFFKEIFR
ncbi:MAG: dienelactone hydrolase [Candidatus Goldiibacteriota bacterium HGW-Goldbacteria-1]|jgi:dienelactone hydrolase|nr:MAG: dienelactone hydrolase [Candidatus Goldiibacteriota bacterium HGW-Goldbacteria-1]